MNGLIVDLFAGGGGASMGIEMALGRSPDIAINHSPAAVAMHTANHPNTEHFCQDVWNVQPTHATQGRPVDLLWGSPDCTHFSKAKGAAPKRDAKIRDLAWVLVKWAQQVAPRVIIMENVEEFVTWGPLDATGKIIDLQRGATFRQFVQSLKRLGYKVDWRELRACDYGAPTIRKRFFLVARRDGQPIVWPEPTHGPGREHPYRTAAEIIDWSIPCPSIFGRARPLAENTLKRIAEGIRRYVVEAAEPFIVNLTHGGRLEPVSGPLRTITCAKRGEKAFVSPYLVKANHGYEHFRGNTLEEPLRTVTASEPGFALAAPLFVGAGGPTYGGKPTAADKPFGTVLVENHQALVSATLVTNTTGHAPTSLDDPVPTLTTGEQQMLASASLIGVGGRAGQSRPRGADEPTATTTSKADTAVVTAFLAKHYGGVVGQGVEAPAGTVTTVDHHGLVAANLTKFYGTSVGSPADDPLHTLTAGGPNGDGRKMGLVSSHLIKLRGTCRDGQRTDAPMPTLTANGTHVGEVRAFLTKYYGQGVGQAVTDPAATVTSKDRMGLVTVMVGGEPYVIADIGMRMLQPRELFSAQGFPDTYKIDIEFNGKPLPKSAQVRACGNSVCPPIAAALVRANCSDVAAEDRQDMPLMQAGR